MFFYILSKVTQSDGMCTDLVFGPGFDQSVLKGLLTRLLKTPSWARGCQDQCAPAPLSIFLVQTSPWPQCWEFRVV